MKLSYIQIIVCFIALFLSGLPLYAQQYQWANGGGTTISDAEFDNNPEATRYMCTDANGNVYALSNVGYYDVYADTSLIGYSYYEGRNMLVTSYNCAGKLRWAKLITSSDRECFPMGIVADTSGHIYVGGTIPNATLYIGTDTTITTNIDQVLGVIQFDTSGNFKWVRHVGDNTEASYEATYAMYGSLAIDNQNNVHLIPYIGYGSPLIPGDTSHLGTYDIEYNSSGNLLSVKRLQIDSTLVVYGATIDKQSNKLYAYGYRNVEFWTDGGGSGDSSYHAFIAAFDTNRNQIWQDTLGDEGSGGDDAFTGIAPDGAGHIYLSGGGNGYLIYKGDTIDYPTGAIGGYIAGVMKLDTAGNMRWYSQFNSHYGIYNEGVTLMSNNKIGTTGAFTGNIDGKIITGTTTTFSTGASATFFSVLDTEGNILTLKNLDGGVSYDNGGNCVASGKMGNLFIGGAVSDSIPDTNLIPAYHSIGGNTDFFVLKYGVDCNCTSMPVCNYSVTGTATVHTTYTGSTTPAIDSVVWSFGDAAGGVSTVGPTDTGLTATHVYTMTGAANLCATVYTGCGSDIHCHSILVNCTGTITAAFSDTGSTIRGFTYTGTTTALDSVTWNFGDGHTATGTTAIHAYTATGTYTVCVTVHTACGSNTTCNTVSIDCAPTASFTHSGSSPVSYTYTGSTTGVDSITWNYGDGHTGAGTVVSHIYSASGTYSVCVTNHTSCGIQTTCESIVVDCAPVAAFTDTGTVTKGFTYTGTTPSLDSIIWNFGDGSSGTGSAVTHFYSVSATYTVCVTAYGLCGSNTICHTVSTDCAPVSNFTYSGLSTIAFTFTGIPNTAAEGLDSVLWVFGDGPTATGLTAVHSYTSTGTFSPCATVFSSCGHDMYCKNIFISCLANASFTHTGTKYVNFTYTGTTIGLDSVVWNFGDGTKDTGLHPHHAYTDTSTYNVCVTLYSSCGKDSVCGEVLISTESVPPISTANIQVFPNPTGDQLNITGVAENTNYRLLNITEICMQKGVLHNGNNTLSTGNVASGVYVLELTDLSGDREMVRVVKE